MGLISKTIGLATVVSAVALGATRREEPVPINLAAYQPPPVAATVDKSPAMQARRKAFIEQLIGLRVFVKAGPRPAVWVGREFYRLEFDVKQRFVSVVYAYYLDGSKQYASVVVYDGYTNKKIGRMSAAGLTLD